ncbi:hypothetical protein [Erwinia mallotivora]|uniref:hypothetical protein n=1 Tax=Erwinia mallotivora TaxID=69222 RepID=UPI0021BFEC89|nr:hypothetical protein [Erwinia mallotivora]
MILKRVGMIVVLGIIFAAFSFYFIEIATDLGRKNPSLSNFLIVSVPVMLAFLVEIKINKKLTDKRLLK